MCFSLARWKFEEKNNGRLRALEQIENYRFPEIVPTTKSYKNYTEKSTRT
jgi:hypothetical protein